MYGSQLLLIQFSQFTLFFQIATIPGAVAIPLGKLRERISELDPAKETVVFCAAGVRANTAARLLTQRGFADVKIYPGGEFFYRLTRE